ncbi:hypothetical protein [Roseococcus pinisoli]|uniref:Uncharacterized protein n=1 Tax=Roseococcus pinisoli TaxID=2835040 RepID=A0ABS5QHU2_9PROT|nr:hypothetical protein [Roseococcus pinisoli]MBS7813137.1 hypothetical protein [Roseococcus pinisoli]
MADGYFAPATGRLRAGDVMIVEASDALSLLPVRGQAALGTGFAFDGAVTPLALTVSPSQTLRLVQTAGATFASLLLTPLVAGALLALPVAARADSLPWPAAKTLSCPGQKTPAPPVTATA